MAGVIDTVTKLIQEGIGTTTRADVATLRDQMFLLPSRKMFNGDPNTLCIVIKGQYTTRAQSNITNPTFKDITINPMNNGNLTMSGDKNTFKFIAPNELTEVVSHTWEPYESVGFKFAQKAALVGLAGAEALGLEKGAVEAAKIMSNNISNVGNSIKNSILGGKTMSVADFFSSGAAAASKLFQSADVYTTRVDSPLVYKGSSRRIYEFIFQLFTTGDGVGGSSTSAYDEVVLPVKLLQYMSSPKQMTSSIGGNAIAAVNPPAIFNITTEPVGLFHVQRAVLKQINPLYRGPYENGAPTSCELHLTFEEYDPLWDRAFSPYSVVTTDNPLGNMNTKEKLNYENPTVKDTTPSAPGGGVPGANKDQL